jgi:hypothetical protein
MRINVTATHLTPAELKVFVATRARLQRLKDAKFFGAWIKDLTAYELRIKLPPHTEISPGDSFHVEMYSAQVSAVCKATFTSRREDEWILNVNDAIKPLPPKENLRLHMGGLPGKIQFDGVEYDMTVQDISSEGMGLVTDCFAPRGATVCIEVETEQGPIVCTGEVRYCRQEATNTNQFRLGLLLNPMGRLERARWARIFEEYAA